MTDESLNDEASHNQLSGLKYAYQPLNTTTSIRVLRLDFDTAEPLTFSVHQRDLNSEDTLDYVAISYTWSGSIGERQTLCDGKELAVPSNVHSVLSRLRNAFNASFPGDLKNDPPLFWLDAICINQAKTTEGYEERATQIPLMRRIYSEALVVIIDLGEIRDTNKLGGDFLFFEYLRYESADSFSWEDLFKWLSSCVSSEQEASHLANEALSTLYRRPWFTRVWVVQEYALAPQTSYRTLFLLGESTTSADRLAGSLAMMGAALFRPGATDEHSSDEDYRGVVNFQTMLQIRHVHPRPAFSSILKRVRQFDATDPRDKIYGCLGLNDSVNSKFKVDYFESLEMLCRRIVLFLLNEEENVDILYQAQNLDHKPGWSSWSWDPFRTQRVSKADDRNMQAPSKSKFNACNGTRVGLVHCEDDELSIEGQEVDQIACLADSPSSNFTEYGIVQYFWTCCVLMMRNQGVSILDPTNCETLWRTLICDEIQSIHFLSGKMGHLTTKLARSQRTKDMLGRRARPWDVLFCWAFHEVSRLRRQYPIPPIPVWLQQMSDDYMESATRGIRDRRPCLTAKGRLGLVPEIAEVADKIVVLNGGRLPFAMRKGPKSYRIVGECYISGVMDGEAVTNGVSERINIR